MNENSYRVARPVGLYDGVLLVDKPAGPTSHDIVDMIRRRFKFDKVGHGGTLDPAATGLLVVLIERGTKLSNLFLTSDKTYEGAMRLGISTDTQDAQGKVLKETDPSGITRETLEAAMKEFTGDIMQAPPMVSAAKKNGVPLYKLARKGKTVDREERLIHVYNFDLDAFEPPLARFMLRCTKGTYVRTLCADVGEKLGCGARLESLRRTRSGQMDVANAISADKLMGMQRDELMPVIIPLQKILLDLTRNKPIGRL